MKARKNIRMTITGKKFEALLPKLGYSKKNTIDKIFQNKVNPTAKQIYKWEEDFNIPPKAWLDVRGYLEILEQEREQKEQES